MKCVRDSVIVTCGLSAVPPHINFIYFNAFCLKWPDINERQQHKILNWIKILFEPYLCFGEDSVTLKIITLQIKIILLVVLCECEISCFTLREEHGGCPRAGY